MFTLRRPPRRKAAVGLTFSSSCWGPPVLPPERFTGISRWEQGWRGGDGSCKRQESMEEDGERKQRWRHPTPRWIPPQLHAAKLHSALFKWLPPLQAWLINIGLPSISRSVESHWHFHTKAAPFLSMKIPRAEAASPDETIYAHGGETEALTWSGHGCLVRDGTSCPRMGPGSREDSGSSSDQRP